MVDHRGQAVSALSKMSASKRVRRTHLHFGVSGHGEAVQAARVDSQACGDQQCCTCDNQAFSDVTHHAQSSDQVAPRCSPPQFAHVPTPWSLRFRFAWTEHLPAIDGSLWRHPNSRSTGLTTAPAGWNVSQVGTLNQSGWGQLSAAVLAEQ